MTSASSLPTCALCDKQGLPILPVRYAIARTDLGDAPSLPPSFGAGVTDIALPADLARYTLRTLRPGYLYVYDEHRHEWRGYVVNSQSYLWEFDIHAKAPPAVNNHVTFNAACRGKSDPYLARCITVKSAKRATQVWLAFSDVAWTAAVLARHASADYRQAHMQCIDIAAWRNGGRQRHVAAFDALGQVAEFAADGATLYRETRAYLTSFFPAPFKTPEDITGIAPEARAALKTLSPMLRDLLVGATGTPVTEGPAVTAAWAFSPQRLHLAREETDAFTGWAYRAAKPWRPAIVGVLDAAGMAMELNGLALQRGIEFLERPEWAWQFDTVSAIDALHNAVLNGAVAKASQSKEDHAAWLRPFVPNPAIRDAGHLEGMSRNIEQAGLLSPDEKNALDIEAWPKYQAMLDNDAWSRFKSRYPIDLQTLDQTTIAPLDRVYVSWLKSDAFTRHFTHNFDPADANNGAIYQRVVHDCIVHASGRRGASAYFKQCLDHDPTQPTEIILRALIFNQQQLATQWTQAASEKGIRTDVSWMEVGEKFYDAVRDTFVNSSLGEDIRGPLSNLCKLLYQLGGPLTRQLGEALNQVADLGAAKLPERRMITLMMGVLRADHPDWVLLDTRSELSPRQAAKALSRAIDAVAGGGAQNLYKSAETLIRNDADSQHRARGLFLIDPAEYQAMRDARNVAKLGAVHVVAEEYEELLAHTTRRMLNAEVKACTIGMLFSAFSVYASYRELVASDDKTIKGMRFGASVTTFLGDSMETSGRLLENAPWAESMIQRVIARRGFEVEVSAAKLVKMGKWLGAIGGMVGAAADMWEGVEDYKFNKAYGYGMTVFGLAEFVAAAMIFSEAAAVAGVGFPLSLLIAVATCCVQYYEPNEIQRWMARSKFGKLPKDEQYRYLIDQQAALTKLAQG